MNDGCDPQMNEYEMYIAQILAETEALKAHAVEVLAKEIGLREASAWGDSPSREEYLEMWNYGSCGKFREACTAEARTLLGWEE